MDVSFCSAGLRDGELTAMAEKTAECGYDGIEVWGPHLDAFLKNRGTAAAFGALCESLGLEITALAPQLDLTGDEDTCVRAIVYGKSYVDLAAQLGRPVIVVRTGRVGSAAATDDAVGQCVYALQEMCEYAQPQGVCLAVETCAGTLADTAGTTLDLLDRVNFPNLRVVLNAWHLFTVDDAAGLSGAVDALQEVLMHVHVLNKVRKHKGPYGTDVRLLEKGDLDYMPVFSKLKEINYYRSVAVEWQGIDRAHMWDQAERDAVFVRQHCNNG